MHRIIWILLVVGFAVQLLPTHAAMMPGSSQPPNAQNVQQQVPPNVTINNPPLPSPNVIVDTVPPVQLENPISTFVASNILPMVLAALGVTASPQLLMILQRLLTLIGGRVETQARAKFEEIVTNGAHAAAADRPINKEDWISKIVAYVQDHGAATLKQLKVDPNNHSLVASAVSAIASKLQAQGFVNPVFSLGNSGNVGADLTARVNEVEDIVKRLGQLLTVPHTQ